MKRLIFFVHDNGPSSNWWRKQGPSHPLGHTGPSQAQDGEHYIYVDAEWSANYNGNDIGIESATINMDTDFYVDFYACMHATYLTFSPVRLYTTSSLPKGSRR